MRLDELRRELAVAAQDQPPVQSDARHRVQRLVRRHRARGAGMVGLVVVAVVVAEVAILRPTERETRISTGPRITAAGMPGEVVAVTTDGRLVVMRSTDGHVTRQLASDAVVDPRGLNGEALSLAITPDGKTVYFMSNAFSGATISSVPLAGGPVTNVLGQGCCVHSPAVSPDGRWLAYSGVPDRSDAGRDILLLDLSLPRGPTAASYTRRWTSSTPLGPGIGIGPLAWAPDSQHLAFIHNDSPDPRSPRVLDINAPESTLLDQLPAVHLPDGQPGQARWAGYLGNTGDMLGITGRNSQVVATDARTGIGTHFLFTLPGATAPAADISGNHLVVTGTDGLYTWNTGDSQPHKIAEHVLAAAWVPVKSTIYRSPPPRANAAMAYDSRRAKVVLFGGYDLQRTMADTWLWDGHGWTLASPTAAPP